MTRDERPYSRRSVRKAGREVGTLTVYPKNVLQLAGFSLAIGLGMGVVIGRVSAPQEPTQIVYNTLSESYFDEPTYNGILYTVRPGDSLSKIVYSYESDPNKAEELIDLIADFNHINANSLRDGQEITLFGVPSSELERFGYSDDYTLFAPTVEMERRVKFLQMVVDSISNLDDANSVSFIEEFNIVYEDYLDSRDARLLDDEQVAETLVYRLRVLCRDAKTYFGYTFEKNMDAIPLSGASRDNDSVIVEWDRKVIPKGM